MSFSSHVDLMSSWWKPIQKHFWGRSGMFFSISHWSLILPIWSIFIFVFLGGNKVAESEDIYHLLCRVLDWRYILLVEKLWVCFLIFFCGTVTINIVGCTLVDTLNLWYKYVDVKIDKVGWWVFNEKKESKLYGNPFLYSGDLSSQIFYLQWFFILILTLCTWPTDLLMFENCLIIIVIVIVISTIVITKIPFSIERLICSSRSSLSHRWELAKVRKGVGTETLYTCFSQNFSAQFCISVLSFLHNF